jgi:hypothetical protein
MVNGPVAVPLLSIPDAKRGAGSGGADGAVGGGGGGFTPSSRIPKRKTISAPPTVRKNFPETWLWTEETIRYKSSHSCFKNVFLVYTKVMHFFLSSATGQKTITAKVPDTITSWHVSAFAMSTSTGIGVTQPSILTVFQPFFVSFTLPYSVIRGEQVSVITTVFNYLSQCSTVSRISFALARIKMN